jgi:NADPH:quinone reductase-like Zn-dependent oxidoreductase
MKALQLSSFGSPTDVVELTEIEPDDPGPGQLAVAIEAAPINPSDLMLIKGIYGVRPELPAALGADGVGRVIAPAPAGACQNSRQRKRPASCRPSVEPTRGFEPRTPSLRVKCSTS